MVDTYDNCEECAYYNTLVDTYGDKIDEIVLQAMVERQEEHLELAHGKRRG